MVYMPHNVFRSNLNKYILEGVDVASRSQEAVGSSI